MRWEHTRRCSRLCRDGDGDGLGVTYRAWCGPGWLAYNDARGAPNWGRLGTFPTRAAAMRAVASACDPKKGGRR